MASDLAVGQTGLIELWPRQGTVQVSCGRTVLVSGEDGVMTGKRAVEGLYVYETRMLSRYRWRMNGKDPEFSCGSNVEQSRWMGYYVQAPSNCKQTPARECDPLQETVELRLTRSVGEGLHEDVQVTNHTQIPAVVRLQLQFEPQFVSRSEAKGERKQHGRLKSNWSHPEPNVWELTTDYKAEHAYDHQGNKGTARLDRGLKLRIENAGSPPRHGRHRVSFRVQLEPHQTWHACLSWIACVDGKVLPMSTACPLVGSSDWPHRRTAFLARAAHFREPGGADLAGTVARVLNRAVQDIADLRLYDLDSPGGIALAAGIPTYMGVFGRDLLASSWEAAMLSPEPLRGSLRVLGERQASEENDWRDAQPGRIVHEVHTDPVSVLNYRPKSLYFGSVSTSFLYPILVSELWHWTGDLDMVRPYADAAIKALKWADNYSLDSTGFYRYQTRSKQGMKNLGWKDSSDAIVYPDGSQVSTPIGTCEMQGFMYAAKLHFSEVLWWLGDKDLARQLYDASEDLKSRFNDGFWMEDEGYFALGIDDKGELIRSVASDPGHCLLTGIVPGERVKQVATRMLMSDLFSGWGVRTLSSRHPAYNPFSYHRGSVWPVENAAFVLAFSRYGLHQEMHLLARAIFEAAGLFQHDRLPEVFGGHARASETPFPGLYTRADWPQAWSASAPLAVLQALAGIYPYAPAKLLFLDPRLPEWLPEITIERLRVGKGVVSLRLFLDSDGETDYEVLRLDGPLHVVRQPSPWSLTTGWAERIKDAVSSL